MFSKNHQAKYLAELIGTFILIFCGTGSIVFDVNQSMGIGILGVAITTGLTVSALIYTIGDISGAHLNPMVTIGFSIIGVFPKKEVIPYIIAQFFGAILASLFLHWLYPNSITLGETNPVILPVKALAIEVVLSFVLMFVILHLAHGSKEQGMFAGIAIGSVVLFEILFAGPVSGASMNPTRSLAPALISGKLANQWIYIASPFIGMFLAIGTWKFFKRS